MNEKHICDCGAPATYHFKNGTWCCSKSRCSCPAYKKKHSAIMSGVHQKFKEKYGDGEFKRGRTIDISHQTPYPSRGDHVCVYCGGHADYQLKDGRWCCHEKKGSCPEIRRKNSEGMKQAHQVNRLWYVKEHSAWNKGLTAATDIRVARQVEKGHQTLREGYDSGRLMLNCRPRVGKRACAYIDRLNESKGWHLQHALNGGEVRVGRYFLDGYDKELNIAFEYDERLHYLDVKANLLKQADVDRMKYIQQRLGCRFFRYNERADVLYEVTSF